jgi:hypothetical protein
MKSVIDAYKSNFHPLGIHTAVRVMTLDNRFGMDYMDNLFLNPLVMALDTRCEWDVNGGAVSRHDSLKYHCRENGAWGFWENSQYLGASNWNQEVYWRQLLALDAGVPYVGTSGSLFTYSNGFNFCNKYAGYASLPSQSPGAWIAFVQNEVATNVGYFITQNNISDTTPLTNVSSDYRGWWASEINLGKTINFDLDPTFVQTIRGTKVTVNLTYFSKTGDNWQLKVNNGAGLVNVGPQVNGSSTGTWTTATFSYTLSSSAFPDANDFAIQAVSGTPILHMVEIVRSVAAPVLPYVSIKALDVDASEVGSDTGTFQITRTGSTSTDLTVSYAVAGTAINGTDYQTLSGSVVIPAGSTTANIVITPITEQHVEGDETVCLTLNPTAKYYPMAPRSSTVYIADAPVSKPIAPSNLAASVISKSEIDLSWSDNSNNEIQFKIERKTSVTTFAEVATVAANVKAFKDTNLSPDTSYSYRVRASNEAGDSSYASAMTVKTLPTIPSAPTNLAATVESRSKITLTWKDNATNEKNYLVERSTSQSGPFVQIKQVGANVTTVSDFNLTANTQYYYRVRASNTGGNSAYSNTVGAKTLN